MTGQAPPINTRTIREAVEVLTITAAFLDNNCHPFAANRLRKVAHNLAAMLPPTATTTQGKP